MDYKHIGLTHTASELTPLTSGQVPALYANMERHPTEKVGSQAFAINQERRALQEMSIMYGSHMAQRTVIERTIVSKAQRLFGSSNHFGLRSVMGKYDEMDFCDMMGDTYEQPQMERESGHSKLQKVYCL